MIAWIVGGLGVALAGGFLLSRMARYGRLFGDDHFLELSRAAVTLKTAALARLIRTEADEPTSKSDPRLVATSAGLLVVYTAREEGSRYIHHWSVSVVGRYTAGAIGTTFVVFVADRCGLPAQRMAFAVGRSGVHHGKGTLDRDEHDAYAATRMPALPPDEVDRVRRAAMITGRGRGTSASATAVGPLA